MSTNHDKWCFAFPANRPTASGADRAALLVGARWAQGDVITVSFLDGEEEIQRRVETAARIWNQHLPSPSFEFRDDTTNTLIRISFKYPGSWSVLGTTCRQIPKGQPTMNFGWLEKSTTDEDLRAVVLHEFGHALGLIHEHQNPGGLIRWNKQVVYDELSKPPNNWPKEVVDHNLFEPYEAAHTNFTKLDPASIMMYPIPARWTDGTFSAGVNKTLSQTDVDFIKNDYFVEKK